MKSFSLCQKGIGRDHCEDNMTEAVSRDGRVSFFAVTDGMGGHAAGEIASEITARTFDTAVVGYEYTTLENLKEFLEKTVRRADEAVKNMADPLAARKMGATLVALAVVPGEKKLIFVNVGDSRGFVVKGGSLLPVTTEDTVENEMKALGYNRAAILNNPDRYSLTKAIGFLEPLDSPKFYELGAENVDLCLLCSDGISSYAPLAEIERILTEEEISGKTCFGLAEAAIKAKSGDDISEIIVKID